MWNERETASFIKKELEKLGIEYEDAAKPGILARIPLDGDGGLTPAAKEEAGEAGREYCY